MHVKNHSKKWSESLFYLLFCFVCVSFLFVCFCFRCCFIFLSFHTLLPLFKFQPCVTFCAYIFLQQFDFIVMKNFMLIKKNQKKKRKKKMEVLIFYKNCFSSCHRQHNLMKALFQVFSFSNARIFGSNIFFTSDAIAFHCFYIVY